MSFPIGMRYQAPNLQATAIQTIEEILMHPDHMFKKGVTVAAGFPHISVGDVVARIAATGLYRRYTPCLTAVAAVVPTQTVALTDIHGNPLQPPYIVGEIIDVGANPANTIIAVDNVLGTVTVALAIAYGLGDAVALSVPDGSDVAEGIAARPLFPPSFDPALPNANFLLDVNYELDVIFQGILRYHRLHGLDAGATADLAGQLIASLDAYIVR